MSGRALLLAAVLGTVAFGLLVQPSVAMTTFSGTCETRGWSQNIPYRGAVPVPSGYAYHSVGHCKGTLNGAPFDGQVQTDIYADMKTLMSCEFGYSTDGGPMYWTFLTGGSNTGIPASAHPPSDQTASAARAPSLSNARAKAARKSKAHASRHRRKHRRKRGHRRGASPTASSTPAPAPATPEPRQNPVLAVWITEEHTGPLIVNNFFGAYRGFATGTQQFDTSPETLRECTSGGNPGLWAHGSLRTITELQG